MTEQAPPAHARCVIVGGGIVGCSVAYHLVKLGWTDVVLLEQGRLSGGTTWHAAGLVGQLRSHEGMTRLVRASTELYAGLEAETGLATGWKQCGSLTVARSNDRMTQLKRTAATARAYGVEAELITAKEAGALWPPMRIDDLEGAVWLPGDGKANPTDLTQALARGARLGGARIFERTRVTGITVEGGAAVGVETSAGAIACEAVVNCAGQWARQLGRLCGVTVPLHSAEHMYIVTRPIAGVAADLPVMRDPDGYIYFKEEVGGLVMGGFEPDAKPWATDGVPDDFAFSLLPDDWDQFEILMDERPGPGAGAGDRRGQDLRQRPRELHPRQQLHPRRGARAPQLLRRRRLQLDGHRQRRRGGARTRPLDRRRRPRHGPVAGGHPPLRPLQRQPDVAARPHQGDPRPALRDAVAQPRAGDRAPVPPLPPLRPARRPWCVLRQQDGLGAGQLVRSRP